MIKKEAKNTLKYKVLLIEIERMWKKKWYQGQLEPSQKLSEKDLNNIPGNNGVAHTSESTNVKVRSI